tara:strand:+ start:29517 stop:30086 length:570 start_codon:yes stop_codon:yes gene_type:complete
MPILKNAKHELFCREFALSSNATAAAVAIGYSAKSARQHASTLLKKHDIIERIAELKAEAAEQLGVTRARWDAHMSAIAFQNMDDYLTFTSDGDPILNIANATPIQRAAISKFRVDDYVEGRGDDARDVRKTEITLHPKLPALIKVGEVFGYIDKGGEGEEAIRAVMAWVTKIQSPDAPLSGPLMDDEG